MDDTIFSQGNKQQSHGRFASTRQVRCFNPPLKKDSQSSQPLSQDGHCTPTAKSANNAVTHLQLAAAPRSSVKRKAKKFNPPQQTRAKMAGGRRLTSQTSSKGTELEISNEGTGKDGCLMAIHQDGASSSLDMELHKQSQKAKQGTPLESTAGGEKCSQLGRTPSVEHGVASSKKRRSHTVLSYCEDGSLTPPEVPSQLYACNDLEDSLSLTNTQEDQKSSFPQGSPDPVEGSEDLHPFNDDAGKQEDLIPMQGEPLGLDRGNMHSDPDSGSEVEQGFSFPRRQFKVPKTRSTPYNFSILSKNPPRGVMKKAAVKRKRIKLALPILDEQLEGRGGGRGGVIETKELDVFDFKPTQEEAPSSDETINEIKLSNLSVTGRTRDEQLAVEADVLQVIARTRVEIKAIRTKYAALKARRIPLTEQDYSAVRHLITRAPIRVNFSVGGRQIGMGDERSKLMGEQLGSGQKVDLYNQLPMAQEE